MGSRPALRRLALLCVLSLAAGLAAAAAKADGSIPMTRDTDRAEFCRAVQKALMDGDFGRIEATARDARSLERRFLGGETELEVVYTGLTKADCVWGNVCAQDDAYEHRQEQLQHWLDRRSNVAMATVALALFWEHAAWAGRGCGYSNTVTAEGWRLFRERLLRSADFAKAMDPDRDPEADYVLLLLVRDLDRPAEEIEAVFNGARQHFPAYYGYYRAYASTVQEKWTGRPDTVAPFVHSLLNNPGGDIGDTAYAFAAGEILREVKPERLFDGESGLDWPTVRRAFVTRERLYGLNTRAWTDLCYLAVAAGDRATARDAFRHFATKLEWWPWSGTNSFYLQVLPWIMQRDPGQPDPPRTPENGGIGPR